MIPKDIENSIVKYLNSEATITELEQLENWLEDADNQIIFKDYVKINFLIEVNTLAFEDKKLLRALSEEIHKSKVISLRRRTLNVLRYASVFIILIASVFLYYINSSNNQTNEQPINEVVLKSENGKINILDQKGESHIKDRNGKIVFEKKGRNLVYSSESAVQSLSYNTITVPYGRQFSLELSDGTKVQLNAGTSFKFPVKFIEGQNRQVYIEYGEAFFEVAKDAAHPFVVNNKDLDITVLGTQFNVSAYPEDDAMTTVLVEGSVQLTASSNASQKTILEPGYKAVWSDDQTVFDVTEADIELHTGWRTGKIIMKSLPFSKMVKKLERHYNVVMDSKNESLNNEVITATFDEESIEEVLKLINKIHPIVYKIDGNSIQIMQN